MRSIVEIKQALAVQRAEVAGNRRAMSFCASCAKQEGRKIISHPLALAISFGVGWFTGKFGNRPKEVKQVRNVTIKRPGLFSQLIKMVAPYIISELRTEKIVKDVQRETAQEAAPQPDPDMLQQDG